MAKLSVTQLILHLAGRIKAGPTIRPPCLTKFQLLSTGRHFSITYCKGPIVSTPHRHRNKTLPAGFPNVNKHCDRGLSNSATAGQTSQDAIFRQFLEYKSYTYTYLLADAASSEAILIDPVIDTVERDLKAVFELGLNLIYAVNTHVHADHVTATGQLKKLVPGCKSVISRVSQAVADVKLEDGDLIKFGKFQIECRSTPGHTDGCMSYVWHDLAMVFTGDTLLIRGCGRTDFQQGSAEKLYDSVHKKIFTLPSHFKVFPGHDYIGQTMSTIGEELRFNPRVSRTKKDFIEIMSKLNLPYPKQMEKAVPLNMVCGLH